MAICLIADYKMFNYLAGHKNRGQILQSNPFRSGSET